MKNVLLVFGGISYEHDISVVTAMQIYNKSRLKEINLILLYVSRDGKFFVCNSKNLLLEDFSKSKFSGKNKKFKEVVFLSTEKGKIFEKTCFGLKELYDVELAIIACHGGDGENGRLVSFFNNVGISCSSGGTAGLALCMDKFLFKKTMQGLSVPVVSGCKIEEFEFCNKYKSVMKKISYYGFPLIIKINNGGSSIGLFIAKDEIDFNDKIKQAFKFDNTVVVEKFIGKNREFNIAILGSKEEFEISEIDEPLKNDDVLTFADKYLSNNGKQKGEKISMSTQQRKFPAKLPDVLSRKIKKYAEIIFKSLDLCGVVRIDFLYDEEKDNLYVCEVNAVPGSLAYYFFKKNKIIVNDLVERLLKIAETNKKKENFNDDFSTNILDKK